MYSEIVQNKGQKSIYHTVIRRSQDKSSHFTFVLMLVKPPLFAVETTPGGGTPKNKYINQNIWT
jgi:hypothetical protein